MNNKMVRFLNSIGINDVESFDMDFDLVSRNTFIREQIDMIIVKDTPWTYELLERFQNGLNTIKYPYTISFSYNKKPIVEDAINLFYDWHRAVNRFNAEAKLEGRGRVITFVYSQDSEIDENKQVRLDFADFLKFLNYRFEIDKKVVIEEPTGPNVSQRKLEKLEEKATEIADEKPSDEEVTETYYKDSNEIAEEAEKESVKSFEQQYINELKANLKKMKKDYKKPFTYGRDESWRNNVEYKPIEDLSQIDVDSGNVDIYGELFGIDKPKTTRQGKMFLSAGIGKKNTAVSIKIMENNNIAASFIETLKNGMNARIAGYTQADKFSGRLVINVVALELLPPPELRKDKEEQKRVELHLHTKMSVMDGVSTIEQYCELAKNMGHKAIAITDHGVTQGYPAAQSAAKATGLKMLYGCELYMVNDRLPFALNPKDIKLSGASYVVFDLETTGLSTRYDRITEFGAIKFEGGSITKTMDLFLNPGMPIPLKIQEKTKITNQMVKNAPSFEEAVDKILDFIGDSILVSHNITFDVGHLNESLRRIGREPLKNPGIDTLSLSRYMFPEANLHNLGALSRNLGISSYNDEEAHRADFDARILNEVWLAMLSRLTEDNEDLMHSDLAKIQSTNAMLKHMRASHVVALAKNKQGLHDLYEIVSKSHIDYLADVPKIPKRVLQELRQGLLIGSGCLNGEIFDLVKTRSKAELVEAMKFYDYIEVQPPENYLYLINREEISSYDEVRKYLSDIVEAANEAGKMVVATGDVHYRDPEDKITRDICIANKAVGGKYHPLHFRNGEYEAPNQHYRTTKEMLDAFEFLGKEKAFEIVVTNTNKIADSIDELFPVQKELHPPVIENSPQILTETCYKRAKELYGDPLPELIQTRLEKELHGIIDHGYSVTYYIANRLVTKANEDGHIVGSRGSVGSSFAAHMFGITEVNPLPPHYRCPKCRHLEFINDSRYLSGYDLPDKVCPVCGEKMVGDGQNIPFETFLGFNAEKIPDIDLNFPRDYQSRAFDYTKVVFGEHNVFRAGTIETVASKTAYGNVRAYYEDLFKRKYKLDELTARQKVDEEVDPSLIAYLASHLTDIKRTTGQHPGGIMVLPKGLSIYDFTPIQYPADDKESTWFTTHLDYTALHDALLKLDLLGHLDPLAVRQLSELTGINPKSIPMNDKKVISLFTSDEALNRKGNYLRADTGATALPEFGTVTGQDILKDAKPQSFADLVAIAGLAHGTDVWNNNARDLILNKTCTIREVIGCRDDIMTYLISKGLPNNVSFAIMEDVRKGRKLKPEYEELMKANNVPQWYLDSCNKIKYMFPKAHACAYVTMAVRVAYFKVYYPLEFYAVWFSTRCKAYDVKPMLGGKDKMIARYDELKKRKNNRGAEKLSPKEEDILDMLVVAIEMAERGYRFENVDLYKSKSTEFVVDKENGALICPFVVIDGLGEAAAESVVEARKDGEFSSQENLLSRTKLNNTNVEDLVEIGSLKDLGESDQMSLFEFGLDL